MNLRLLFLPRPSSIRDASPPLTSLRGLLDVGLLLHVLLMGTLLHATWAFGLRVFRVFHTEVSSRMYTLTHMYPPPLHVVYEVSI